MATVETPAAASTTSRLSPGTLIVGACILVSSLVLALVSIHYKLFWVDELLEYYTDAQSSAAAIVIGQLRHPFSLEPPAFHVLPHILYRLLPTRPEFSLRILSALSLVITEVCVFRITFRLTGQQGLALLAMVFPLLMTTMRYASEGRVYSFLTALFAIALVSYQTALGRAGRSRILPLVALFLSLAAAVLVHYFGILLPLPLLAGEVVRSMQRRRLDWPLVAILGAFVMFVFNLPFLHALAEIRAHYYDTGETHWRMIPFTYAWLFAPDRSYLRSATPVSALLFYSGAWIAVALFLRALAKCRSIYADVDCAPVFAAVMGGALLPVLNLLVAHYFTHAYVPRYSLPAVVPISVGLALVFGRRARNRMLISASIAALMIAGIYGGQLELRHYVTARRDSVVNRSSNDNLRAVLVGAADQNVYVQATAEFLTTRFYADRELRDRMVGVESKGQELFWLHRDPGSIFLRNIGMSTDVPVVSYECLERVPGAHIFLVYRDPREEWIDRVIASGAVTAEPVGHALSGTIYRVSFPHPLTGTDSGSVGECISHLKDHGDAD